jgi:hypothetical protein
MRLKTYIFGGACLLAGLGSPIGMAAGAPEQAPTAAGAQRTDPSLETLRAKAQERMALDRNLLSSDEFRELESLYQLASRDLRSPDAKAKLKEVVRRFPQSNRAGCAALYLAQMSEGTEREEYLKSAIANYGNSWYGTAFRSGRSRVLNSPSPTRTQDAETRRRSWQKSSGCNSRGLSIIRAPGWPRGCRR